MRGKLPCAPVAENMDSQIHGIIRRIMSKSRSIRLTGDNKNITHAYVKSAVPSVNRRCFSPYVLPTFKPTFHPVKTSCRKRKNYLPFSPRLCLVIYAFCLLPVDKRNVILLSHNTHHRHTPDHLSPVRKRRYPIRPPYSH